MPGVGGGNPFSFGLRDIYYLHSRLYVNLCVCVEKILPAEAFPFGLKSLNLSRRCLRIYLFD